MRCWFKVHVPFHAQDKRTQHEGESLAHAVALHFMYYNFVGIHQSLRCTPAMAAGDIKELYSLVVLR